MKAFCTLLKNELKLNIRNMNMVIFALLLPLVVLVILGFLYGTNPAADGADYTFLEQSIGALCAISVCAGGLMGLPLVVAEYRERKILKRFQVTPISPSMLLTVEFLIYVLYALVSLITLLLVSGMAWGVHLRGSWVSFAGSWRVFPMTQGIQLMKSAFLGLSVEHFTLPILVMLAVTLACSGIAVKCFKWE